MTFFTSFGEALWHSENVRSIVWKLWIFCIAFYQLSFQDLSFSSSWVEFYTGKWMTSCHFRSFFRQLNMEKLIACMLMYFLPYVDYTCSFLSSFGEWGRNGHLEAGSNQYLTLKMVKNAVLNERMVSLKGSPLVVENVIGRRLTELFSIPVQTWP